jgi:hypothetical protein
LKTSPEILLLFGLTSEEKTLVNGLISSFEMETVDLSINTIESFVAEFPEKKICLIVFHIDENQEKQHYTIRVIRTLVGNQVPFLVLVPPEKSAEIDRYLKAGADDYMDLPLNKSRFSIGFLILLELGQAMPLPQKTSGALHNKQRTGSDGFAWKRIADYFQKELSYFSPKSLLMQKQSDIIADRWKHVKKLGRGGFGEVWLVEEIGTGRLAVAKTPHSSQMNICVLRSAAILKRLVHHPNIIQLIEITKGKEKLSLILEYVEGQTLQELLLAGMTPPDKENSFLQLLSAVSYSHENKILHRDIKPENIIISKTGRLKLFDFGIAQDLSWQSPGTVFAGTVNYTAPEQFEGKVCLASDIWPLGVILYIFATKKVPYILQFDRYSNDNEMNFTAKAPRELTPNLDIELERIIMQCLQKDLLKRYHTATELQDDILTTFPRFGTGEIIPW